MQRLPDAILKGYPGTLNSTEKDPFFVLSTGRAGSETICNLLSQHPEVDCIHEPKDALIRLSDGYFHGLLTEDQVSAELRTIYTEISCFPNNVYGESDQKLSNLALLLSQVVPNAKFVWLIREPVNTVLSTFSRGWFSDEELLMNESEEFYKSGLYRRQYSDFRPQASLCGDMPESEWRAMTMFERNCWYWYRWNLEIKNQLDKIDNSRWIQIKTEDINQEYSRLLDFLGVENLTLDATVSNKARTGQYALLGRNDLTPEMRASLDKWCLNSDLYTK